MKTILKSCAPALMLYAFYFGFIFINLIIAGCSDESQTIVEPHLEPHLELPFKVDERPRVFISTDIGGGDPDDEQSLIHALLYSNTIRIEGIVTSIGHGKQRGKTETALNVINSYAKDYPNLKAHDERYPEPDYLRTLVKPGKRSPQPEQGFSSPTEASELLIEAASKVSTQPLQILVWGASTDVAQALHDMPTEYKTRVTLYTIGFHQDDKNARNYIRNNHQEIPWIEAGTTFRGMYLGGPDKNSDYGNVGFVKRHKNAGHLGGLLNTVSKDINVNAGGIKMGDSPSFLFVINGNWSDPGKGSWGGKFCHKDHAFWTDCQDDSLKLDSYPGARSVSQHRLSYLKHWEERFKNVYPKQ